MRECECLVYFGCNKYLAFNIVDSGKCGRHGRGKYGKYFICFNLICELTYLK